MIAVVTPDEMRKIDAAAAEPVDVLIERAGAALAKAALADLGGTYGRRVVVVAGKGNNGADGRAAAQRLQRRGVRVRLYDAGRCPPVLPRSDLVIDAAYGTGFRGDYAAPDPAGARVLAVDIPSGVDGVSGAAGDGAVRADFTVTFAALKPGLLFTDRAGSVTVADIGLEVEPAGAHVIEAADVSRALPSRAEDRHKYAAAVAVVAGSPGMLGAATLTSHATLRAGAGYCRLATPGASLGQASASEVVSVALPPEGWAHGAVALCERMRAVAVGPGLGRAPSTQEEIRSFVAAAPIPAVVDADALFALGDADAAAGILRQRAAPAVLTPHEGEFTRLAGDPPGADRIEAVRMLARRVGATVLLKGAVTVVADPGGRVLVSTLGSPSLATAGTGDVLTGVVAAFLAEGLDPLAAAGHAAAAHGAAAAAGHRRGLVASDLLDLLPRFLSGR